MQPFDDVFATITARSAWRAAHAKMNFAACEVQVFGKLAAGLPGAHDEDFAFRQ